MTPGPSTGRHSVVPPAASLPDVLPTDRLRDGARLRTELRADLRRIPNAANALTVVSLWLQIALVIGGATWLHHPVVWVLAFLLMGRAFSQLLILGHEAAHLLLFSNRRVNDFVGKWLLDYPGLVPFEIYRKGHMAHHKDEMGPDEPDKALYAPYPITRASLRRKLTRDAFFVSGWKNLWPLLGALRSRTGRPIALKILAAQLVLIAAFTALGRPELYVFLWLAPWMTVWRVINRLRAIAEHGGMIRSTDRRQTTHHVQQSAVARFALVPYNTGWHLAHHVDVGIPYRNLPALHRELEAAGWVTPELVYPNYRALWRALASRPSQ
ncbi:MAG: fatty acid desaturase family protein [Acidimicrobiales bacterium]